MTSNLRNEIRDHFSQFTSLSGKDDAMSFVHAMAQFYPNVTPVGGHYGAIGHWWLETTNGGETIDPFNPNREWPYDAHKRGIKELERAINQHVFSENIYEHSAEIFETVSKRNDFTFESKIGEVNDYDEDFEDDFDFLDDDEPKPQGPQP